MLDWEKWYFETVYCCLKVEPVLTTTNYFHFHLFRLTKEFPLPVAEDLLRERNCLLKAPPSSNEHGELSVAGNILPRSGVSCLIVTRPTREKVVAEN